KKKKKKRGREWNYLFFFSSFLSHTHTLLFLFLFEITNLKIPMHPIIFAFGLSTLLVVYTRRKKSLTRDGAGGAFVLGMTTFASSYWLFTVVLLTFFLTSSKLTKFKAERKRLLEDEYDLSSERNLTQVLCNGLVGGIAVSFFHTLADSELVCYSSFPWGKMLLWIYIGHYSCCAGDTWASELGILNSSWPFLITKWERVPPGTNGGVSPLGLFASLAGGLCIGLVAALSLALDQRCHGFDWSVIILGAMAGLGGSLIDSILGATIQETVYSKDRKMIMTDRSAIKEANIDIRGWNILDNHQVNFVSSLLTSSLCGLAALYFQ
ncbi:integral membrane protein DUF92-domain-containing protein, partial [Halteromyces radiatus]|uniref:integral membrane protein DUF92-domain-containing protein n=1 Tax=Halteromyces radiatus TaxID=101107 RepID=UPI002220A68B